MQLETIFTLIKEFCKGSHGSSNYDEETLFIMGESTREFAPFRFLKKKLENDVSLEVLQNAGFIFNSHDFLENSHFKEWFEKQFSIKCSGKMARNVVILYYPNQTAIFEALETVNRAYDVLRKEQILLNSKNFPIQLGEWYAKSIFGLKQVKSTSQRGFDFELEGKRVEVKIHWGDSSSPKGVKIKKSLVELSDWCIILYENFNFMIRDVCLLDSDFILRKFSSKGHTVFLKDTEISSYFFGRSSKQFDKVVNKTALMTFASPQLALKLEGRLYSE